MALLAGTNYDPTGGAAVTKATSSLIVMTAIDTTNLRLTFTAPANGKVLVRMRCCTHGSTTQAVILLGILSGASVVARQTPVGALSKGTALATTQIGQEALFVVTGLTPGNSYTWDAAYGVEVAVASTALKYGGPNNTTTNDAFGGFVFEVWEAPNLLAGTLYDPGTAGSNSTASNSVMAAMDTTNLRLTFTAPTSGKVLVRLRGIVAGATTFPQILLGVLDGSTVIGRQSPVGANLTSGASAGTPIPQEASFVATGLTPGNSYTWDAAWGTEIAITSTAIKYGGPNNNTTSSDAWGGFAYEIWRA